MSTAVSFSVDFIPRQCKAEKSKVDIYARITVNGERKELSLKVQVLAKDWYNEREMVRGKSMEVKSINDYIENVRVIIRQKYRELENSHELITADAVKNAYLGIQNNLRGHKLTELLTYFVKIWKDKLKKGGFKNYKTTVAYLQRFLETHFPSKDIYLSQLTMEFMTEFEHYVRNTPMKEYDPCLGNGVGKHIQRIKRMVNWAVELGWLSINPVERYSCTIKKNKRKKLSIDQLIFLEKKTFQAESLNYVKELFLCGCYTGLAFADIMELSDNSFESDVNGVIWCKIYRQKTDGLSPVPLLKSAASIVDKYRHHPDSVAREKIFPALTNQYVNRCLKIIQEACEFDLPLTFHVARHTFAKTVALKNGIPLETVQMMMGHTKISTTQIYADVDEEKIMSDMQGLEEKLNAKRGVLRIAN